MNDDVTVSNFARDKNVSLHVIDYLAFLASFLKRCVACFKAIFSFCRVKDLSL